MADGDTGWTDLGWDPYTDSSGVDSGTVAIPDWNFTDPMVSAPPASSGWGESDWANFIGTIGQTFSHVWSGVNPTPLTGPAPTSGGTPPAPYGDTPPPGAPVPSNYFQMADLFDFHKPFVYIEIAVVIAVVASMGSRRR